MRPDQQREDAAVREILFVLSEWGYWGEELVGPLEACQMAGYATTFATPTGARPQALPVSMDPTYIDPPLGREVVSQQVAEKTRTVEESDLLAHPVDLSSWIPQRPYPSSPTYLRDMEGYFATLDRVGQEEVSRFDALVIVGGSGALVDLANNDRVLELVLMFYRADKPIACECYGVSCLAFARDQEDRRSIIAGRHVTGHPIEYDYKDGTGFLPSGALNFGPPFYPLEYILRDAVGPEGQFHGNIGKETSVIVDYPFITARSTADSYLCGEKLVEVLEKGLTTFGWR
jgi:putative intracellular protease/amidase